VANEAAGAGPRVTPQGTGHPNGPSDDLRKEDSMLTELDAANALRTLSDLQACATQSTHRTVGTRITHATKAAIATFLKEVRRRC
jgi:hypothetical protein